jgi:Arc/MetJ-type ribon-helix-helix transcriptional regulator
MAAITISVPPHVKDWIDEQVSEGRFPDEDAVIVDAVEQAMTPAYRWDLDPEVDAALAQIERGEGIVITDLAAYFDRVTHEASEAAARGEVVRDDLKY